MRFALGCALWISMVQLVTAQVLPVELQPGESIGISCATCPVCPQSCEPTGPELCTGGADEDCDGAIDCADTDCAAAPECEAPEPGEAPAAWGRYRWDHVHSVLADGTTISMGGAGPPGSFVHHFLDLGGAGDREPTQFEPAWWGQVSATGDAVVIDGIDDQYPINGPDWLVPGGSALMVAFVGTSENATHGAFLGSKGECTGSKYGLGIIASTATAKRVEGTVGGGVWLRFTDNGTITKSERFGLLTVRRANGDWLTFKRGPCGTWQDVTLYTNGLPPNRDYAQVCFGCLGCYYPNGWQGDPAAFFSHGMHFREMALIDGDGDEQAWKGYLEAEHGAWIDEGCN